MPGRTLAGLRLGATPAQVQTTWGSSFGLCRNCRDRTWYFNYKKFEPQGAGVAFRAGRAVALFTLWSPAGWHTSRGVYIGESVARVTLVYGAMPRTECGTYYALTMPRGKAVTTFYVVDEKVWGFGLSRPGVPVCR